MKNAIVTGGTGFIGSWLILELLKNNIHVTAVVRNKEKLLPEISNNMNCYIIEKTIQDLSGEEFDKDVKYDVFYHLGWSGVSVEYKNDVSMQIENIIISLHALEICNKINCAKFIVTGTVAEYTFCDNVMNLLGRQSPNDMYGAAKVSAYFFLDIRARQLGQFFLWAIIPSTFGPRRIDNNIITYTIQSLLQGNKPLYGNLEQMWDFLYVEDVVRALRLLGEYGKNNKTYGIGSGQYHPLKNYIIKIRDIIAPTMELGIGAIPAMSKQTFSSCVNNYDLIKDTGFYPEVSFEDGIKKTISWFKFKS